VKYLERGKGKEQEEGEGDRRKRMGEKRKEIPE
jgi:hypothetical protein